MNKRYRRTKTTVSLINYHFVFCPKYRRKIFLFPGVEERFKTYTKEICEQKKIQILAMECHIDHVHLFLQCLPDQSPSDVIPPRTTGVGRGFPTFRAGSSIIYRSSMNLVPLSAERRTTSMSTIDRCGGIAATDRNFCLFRDTRSLTDSGSY